MMQVRRDFVKQADFKRIKLPLPLRLLLILLICVADIAWGAGLIYRWQEVGAIISVKDASSVFGKAFLQHLTLAAAPILLLAIVWAVFKNHFAEEMALTISGKKQRAIVLVLIGVLFCETVAALIVKADVGPVLYGLLYYTVFIAFTEEFVIRGVCVRLLKEEKTWLRYLWPNCLFAAMHFFSYADWGNITANYALRFFTGSFLGLVAAGCGFQLMKEKTGTLWVPILVHAALDFGNVFSW